VILDSGFILHHPTHLRQRLPRVGYKGAGGFTCRNTPLTSLASIRLFTSSGFAFIEYNDPRDAREACNALNQTRFQGVTIRVEISSGIKRGYLLLFLSLNQLHLDDLFLIISSLTSHPSLCLPGCLLGPTFLN